MAIPNVKFPDLAICAVLKSQFYYVNSFFFQQFSGHHRSFQCGTTRFTVHANDSPPGGNSSGATPAYFGSCTGCLGSWEEFRAIPSCCHSIFKFRHQTQIFLTATECAYAHKHIYIYIYYIYMYIHTYICIHIYILYVHIIYT